MKTIDTLIEDVVDLAEKGVDLQHHKSSIDRFSKNMRELIEEFLSKKEKGKHDFRLRMSALGTPARKLWYQKNNIDDLDKFSGGHLIKFFYGHMIEELVLLLAEVSGHKVEHRQRELQLYDVIGHQDAEIDGVSSEASYEDETVVLPPRLVKEGDGDKTSRKALFITSGVLYSRGGAGEDPYEKLYIGGLA